MAAKRIYKYPLALAIEVQAVEMTPGAPIVHVAKQYGQICLWAYHDEELADINRHFVIVDTGEELPPFSEHVGTVLDGVYVWHVVELLR